MDTAVRPQGCTHLKLRQLMRRVAQLYDLELATTGLKTTQYSLLSYVSRLGPIRPGDLARGLKMSASTLTRNLRPLADAGWVEVGAGTDGRSRTVSITEAGREKRQEAQRHWRVAQDALNEVLGLRRVASLHGLIDECLDLLSPVPDGETDE